MYLFNYYNQLPAKRHSSSCIHL